MDRLTPAEFEAKIEAEIAEIDRQAQVVDAAPVVVPEAAPVAVDTAPITEEPITEPISERKVFQMPVEKHQRQVETLKEKHAAEVEALRAEYENKLKASPKGVDANTSDAELKSLIEENDLDPKVTEQLVTFLEKRLGKSNIPEDVQSRLEKIDGYEKEKELMEARRIVDQEFDRDITPEIVRMYPDVTQEHIQSVKKQIQDLAFTERFHKYPLKDILAVKSADFAYKSRPSAEPSRGGASVGMVDYAQVTTEEIAKMSPAEAEKYFAWEDAKGGSRYKT